MPTHPPVASSRSHALRSSSSSPSPSFPPVPSVANDTHQVFRHPGPHLVAEGFVGFGEREIHRGDTAIERCSGFPESPTAAGQRSPISGRAALKRPGSPCRPMLRVSSAREADRPKGSRRRGTLARETHESGVSSQKPMAPWSWCATRNTIWDACEGGDCAAPARRAAPRGSGIRCSTVRTWPVPRARPARPRRR